MNNIWKYSLALAFSIIIDQLVKGTAQSLIPVEGGTTALWGPFQFVRLRNVHLIFGIQMPFLHGHANTIAALSCSVLIFWCLKKIVINRNINPLMGWGYNLLLIGLFTSWLDRVSQGFTLNYLSLKLGSLSIPFSVGDLFFTSGLFMISTLELRKLKK